MLMSRPEHAVENLIMLLFRLGIKSTNNIRLLDSEVISYTVRVHVGITLNSWARHKELYPDEWT